MLQMEVLPGDDSNRRHPEQNEKVRLEAPMKKKLFRLLLLVLVVALNSVLLTGCFNGGGLGDGGGFLGFGLLGPGNAFGDVGPGGTGSF